MVMRGSGAVGDPTGLSLYILLCGSGGCDSRLACITGNGRMSGIFLLDNNVFHGIFNFFF